LTQGAAVRRAWEAICGPPDCRERLKKWVTLSGKHNDCVGPFCDPRRQVIDLSPFGVPLGSASNLNGLAPETVSVAIRWPIYQRRQLLEQRQCNWRRFAESDTLAVEIASNHLGIKQCEESGGTESIRRLRTPDIAGSSS
jgi:hypothetical protein